MSPNINIRWLIGSIMIFMLPVIINAQEQDREQVLLVDIDSLVTKAVRDRIITKEESQELVSFVRDSLPEGTDLKVRALEQIRDELDDRYAEMVRNSMKLLDLLSPILVRVLSTRAKEFAARPEKPVSNERRSKKWLREQTVTFSVLRDIREFAVRSRALPKDPASLYIALTLISRLRSSMTLTA